MSPVTYPHLGIDLVLADLDLTLSGDGDFAITNDGGVTLMQDVQHLIDTLPGDLYAHPDYGCGLQAMVGEEDAAGFAALATRIITDAMIHDVGIGPRINHDSLVVAVTAGATSAAIAITYQAIGSSRTSTLNLVWGYGYQEATE